MSVSENNVPSPGDKVIARAAKDRRRFKRVRISVAGRLYIPATQEEAICTVEDISPGDASILCDLHREPEGRAVIYLDGLGRFEGPVVRSKPGGFVMTFACSHQKREKLAEQLALEINRHLLSESDVRRHERVDTGTGSFTHYTRYTGEQIRCEVLDLSLTGVSVRTESRPPIGEHILIGNRAGRVARHHGDGIGVEFLGLASSSADGAEKSATISTVVSASMRSQPFAFTATGTR